MTYCDLQMNSLEDAYINIAKAEEKLHNNNELIVEKSLLDQDSDF